MPPVLSPPGEVLTQRLTLRPTLAGWVRVTGVAWLLAGVAEGIAAFDIRGRRRKRPKGDRCDSSAVRVLHACMHAVFMRC